MSNILQQWTSSRIAGFKPGTSKPQSIAARKGDTGEIYLYGVVGFPEFGGTGAKEFVSELRKLDGAKQINLYINSPGGDVFEGLSIYNQLAASKAEKHVYVDGEAASIASVIAMAGDRVLMYPESQIMIHEARVLATGGTAGDLRKLADEIEASTSSIRDVYARRTGLPAERLSELMAAETTMRAPQAVELKFADAVVDLPARQAAIETKKISTNLTPIQVARLRAQLAGRK